MPDTSQLLYNIGTVIPLFGHPDVQGGVDTARRRRPNIPAPMPSIYRGAPPTIWSTPSKGEHEAFVVFDNSVTEVGLVGHTVVIYDLREEPITALKNVVVDDPRWNGVRQREALGGSRRVRRRPAHQMGSDQATALLRRRRPGPADVPVRRRAG